MYSHQFLYFILARVLYIYTGENITTVRTYVVFVRRFSMYNNYYSYNTWRILDIRLNSSFKTVDEWCLYISSACIVLKISASDILNYDDVYIAHALNFCRSG